MPSSTISVANLKCTTNVKFYHAEYESLLENGNFYALETGKSEDLAAFAHFFLTVTPYGQSKRDWQKDLGGQTSKMDQKEPERDKSPKATPVTPPKAKDSKSVIDDDKKSVGGKSEKTDGKSSKNK